MVLTKNREIICLRKDCEILSHFFPPHYAPILLRKRWGTLWRPESMIHNPSSIHNPKSSEQEPSRNLCMASFFDNEGMNVRWLYWDQLVLAWLVRDKMWPQKEKELLSRDCKGIFPQDNYLQEPEDLDRVYGWRGP